MSNYNLSSMDPMGPFQGISHGSSRVWKPAILNLDEMEYLKYYTLAEKKIIFFGGKVGSPFATYQSLSDLDDYFDPRSHDSYNKNIQFGHLADYFMGGFGAGDVFHFSALDAVESLDEDQNNTYITGRAHTVSQQALIQRAAELVADPLFMSPIDAVVINHDFVVPIAEEVPFETYLSYLFSRVRRSIGAAAATIEAVYPSIKAQGRIILIIGPLTLLAVNGHEGWTDPGLLAEYRLLTGEFFSRVNRNNNISLHIITGDPTISIQAVPTRAWRDGLNQLATHGYSRDMNRIIGCRIARAVAWGDRRLTGREADAIYSQVLVRLQRMRQGFTLKTRIESLQTIISRAQFLKRILHHAENRGPDTPGGGRRNGITEVQSTADIPSVSTSSQPQPLLIPKLKHMFPGLQRLSDIPLRGQVALVLHSGRRDGVTEACCLELAQLGATVAFTYTQGEVRSKEMANNILGKIMEAKGAAAIATAIDIPAVPYRYEIYTERPHEDVKFIDGAVKYVLGYFQINKFDIIVNNVGQHISLDGAVTQEDKAWRLLLDSLHNTLALNYIMECCAENGSLAKHCRVVNIASMATNSGAVDYYHEWEYNLFFMDLWKKWTQQLFSNPYVENPVRFSTVIPGSIFGGDPRSCTKDTRDRWWSKLELLYAFWCKKETVKDTAKIVAHLVRPDCNFQCTTVAPDDQFP